MIHKCYNLKFVIPLCLSLAMVTGLGCSGKPQPGIPSPVGGDRELAAYQGGTIALDEAVKWFSLHGDRTTVPMVDSNETQWVEVAVKSMVIERLVQENVQEAGIDQLPETLKRREELLKEGVSRLYFQRHLVENIKVPRREIENEYRENLENYRIPATYRFRMIFFDAEKHGRDKAQRRAQRVLERIQHGAPFDTLIEEYSDVEVRKRLKEFGPYKEGEGLIPGIEQAALALEVGRVSDIIEHRKGFHIIKLISKTDAYQRPLEEVEEEIRERLAYRKLITAEEKLVEQEKEHLAIQERFHVLELPITAPKDIVLRVGDEVLTYGDYLDMLRERQYANAEQFQAAFRKRYRNMVYLALGREKGYDQDPEVLEWVALTLRREMSLSYLKRQIDERATASEEEIRQIYDDKPFRFQHPRMIFARQIYIPIATREGMSRHELVQEIYGCKAKAVEIIGEIEQGLSFTEAARLYSSDPNADRGGVIGWVPFGTSRRFDNAAFKLQEGQISSRPVERKRGYQILKVEKKIKSRPKTYEECRDEIWTILMTQKANTARTDYLAGLLDGAQVRINDEVAQRFKTSLEAFWRDINIYNIGE